LPVPDLEDRGGVGADGEERRVAHRQESHVADQQIRAEREEPEDQDLDEQARPERVQNGGQHERDQGRERPGAASHCQFRGSHFMLTGRAGRVAA